MNARAYIAILNTNADFFFDSNGFLIEIVTICNAVFIMY